MISKEMVEASRETLLENWEKDAKCVIEQCEKVAPFNGTFKEFLSHCTCCGGNWGGMLLTGIKELYPNVWEAIPNDMGVFAFSNLCNLLILCGVDTSADQAEVSSLRRSTSNIGS